MNNVNDFKTENIVGDLNLILLNIPENLSLIEKVRWLYIKVGRLFSYDYRIVDDFNVAFKDLDFNNNYVSKYQTCVQISYILNMMLNFIDHRIKANVIERKLNIRGIHNVRGVEHQANEIILPTGEKYILDLTLDLFLIQSGCQTKHFGYETDASSTYDIISLKELKELDLKLGLINNGFYTDDVIKVSKSELDNYDYSNMSYDDIMNFKLNKINDLMKQFNGYQEGILYINKLFDEILDMNYKEFNLYYKHNNMNELIACFVISFNCIEKWVLYSSKLGLVNTTYENINEMLSNGWETKSNTLTDIRNNRKK